MKKKVFCLVLLAVLALSATSVYAGTRVLGWVNVSSAGQEYQSLEEKTNYTSYAVVTCKGYRSTDIAFYVEIKQDWGSHKTVTETPGYCGEYSSSALPYLSGYGKYGNKYILYAKAMDAGGLAYLEYTP